MGARHDLAGQRFSRWLVLSFDHASGKRSMWRCRCDCGEIRVVRSDHLKSGLTKSCGCWKVEELAVRVSRVGQYSPSRRHHPLEATYATMLQRCLNPKSQKYPDYGARGIRICDRWLHGEGGLTGFDCYIADIGDRPSRKHSIDRKDNDGNYEPGNVRWATAFEQVHNRRKRKPPKRA